MKALVTGASGFIGHNLVDTLVNQGWEVVVLLRRPNIFFKEDSKIQKVYGDLTVAQSLSPLNSKVKKVDIIFNLAGGLPHHHLSDEDYRQVNVDGVKNLLEVALKLKIKKFVHVSTIGIYKTLPGKIFGENSPLSLTTSYAKTKAEGENLVLKSYKNQGLPITIIKPTIAYGPYDTRPGFSNLFSLISQRKFIPVGKNNHFFHTVYVGNLINALLLAAQKKQAIGEDFIIGDDPCPTMKEVIETIARIEGVKLLPLFLPRRIALALGKAGDIIQKFGLKAPLTTQRVRFITEEKRFTIDKAKKILGYKAIFSLEEGLERTYHWYRDQHYL